LAGGDVEAFEPSADDFGDPGDFKTQLSYGRVEQTRRTVRCAAHAVRDRLGSAVCAFSDPGGRLIANGIELHRQVRQERFDPVVQLLSPEGLGRRGQWECFGNLVSR